MTSAGKKMLLKMICVKLCSNDTCLSFSNILMHGVLMSCAFHVHEE